MTVWMEILLAQSTPGESTSSGGYGLMILAFLVVLVSFFLMLRAHRRVLRRQRDANLSVPERVARYTHQARDVHTQIGELMAELADLARQVNGQLDSRMVRLEALLDRADETLARLARADQAGRSSSADPILEQPATSRQEELSPTQDRPVGMNHEEACTPPSLTDTPGASGGADTQISREETPTWRPPRNPLLNTPSHRRIVTLAEQGRSPLEIAQELHRPVGEIELILSLHGKNQKSSGN